MLVLPSSHIFTHLLVCTCTLMTTGVIGERHSFSLANRLTETSKPENK